MRLYSLKIRKMEKNTKKTTLLCPSVSNKPTHLVVLGVSSPYSRVGGRYSWYKSEFKKGGATLISPSSSNFTAVFLSSLSKGMELRFIV